MQSTAEHKAVLKETSQHYGLSANVNLKKVEDKRRRKHSNSKSATVKHGNDRKD